MWKWPPSTSVRSSVPGIRLRCDRLPSTLLPEGNGSFRSGVANKLRHRPILSLSGLYALSRSAVGSGFCNEHRGGQINLRLGLVLPHFVWLTGCRHRICYLRECARNRNGHPAQGSMFWASHSKTTANGPFPRSRSQSERVRIAVCEVVIGTVGASALFKTFRFRGRW